MKVADYARHGRVEDERTVAYVKSASRALGSACNRYFFAIFMGMAKFQLVSLSACGIVVARSEEDALQSFVGCFMQMAGFIDVIPLQSQVYSHFGYIKRPSPCTLYLSTYVESSLTPICHSSTVGMSMTTALLTQMLSNHRGR